MHSYNTEYQEFLREGKGFSVIRTNTSLFSIRWMTCSKYCITGNFQTVIIIRDVSGDKFLISIQHQICEW